MKHKTKKAFTLIELIVVMAVIGILVLLAAPKFLGYTERARETKHIHTAKVIETALEAYLINGGAFPDGLEVVDRNLLEEAANKESLVGVNGYVTTIDEEIYYELTYDFIKKLDVKLSASNKLLVEALASNVPTAVYATEKGITLVDKAKTMKGYELQPGEIPNEINPIEIMQIETSGDFNLVLKQDGTVWAWGKNTEGQLGDGTTLDRNTPVMAKIPVKVKSIATGYRHSIALSEDGDVYTWGYNELGQLGNGTKINSSVPNKIWSNIYSISSGIYHSFAIEEDGTAWAWGNNSNGQLGNGVYTNATRPVRVMIDNVKIIKGGITHTLAIRKDNTLWVWGNNTNGKLGTGINSSSRNIPIQILSDVKDISAGIETSIALKEDGSAWIWGDNYHGQVGDGRNGNDTDRHSPYKTLNNVKSIDSSWYHILAIKEDDTLWAWGYKTGFYVPTQISSGIKVAVAGHSHNVAIKKEDSSILWTWGEGKYGQLGNNKFNSYNGNYMSQVINNDGSYFYINE